MLTIKLMVKEEDWKSKNVELADKVVVWKS